MIRYDVVIGWSNYADYEFVKRLRKVLAGKGHSFREVTLVDFEEGFAQAARGELPCDLFIDRGSIDYPPFLTLAEILKRKGARISNDPIRAAHFGDKAKLNALFKTLRLPVLPIQTVDPRRKHSGAELEKLIREVGTPFVIKPSHSADQGSVRTNARTASEIRSFAEKEYFDTAIIEPFVSPIIINRKPAWFRPLYAHGIVIAMWWNPKTHRYSLFGKSQTENDISKILSGYARKIYAASKIDLFTFEAAIIEKGGLPIIIDYINQPIDLNIQSRAKDSLPEKALDMIVESICTQLTIV